MNHYTMKWLKQAISEEEENGCKLVLTTFLPTNKKTFTLSQCAYSVCFTSLFDTVENDIVHYLMRYKATMVSE